MSDPEAKAATSAVMARQSNQLGEILRRPVWIDVSIPWEGDEGDGLSMAIQIARCASWSDVAALQQMQALGELDNEPTKVGGIVDFVCTNVTDSSGVPDFGGRRPGESVAEFRERFRAYFVEAEAEMLLLSVFAEYNAKEPVPLVARRATFRP